MSAFSVIGVYHADHRIAHETFMLERGTDVERIALHWRNRDYTLVRLFEAQSLDAAFLASQNCDFPGENPDQRETRVGDILDKDGELWIVAPTGYIQLND